MTPTKHEYRITDEKTRKRWETLLGKQVTGDRVTVDHDFYMTHRTAITSIQFSANLRDRSNG